MSAPRIVSPFCRTASIAAILIIVAACSDTTAPRAERLVFSVNPAKGQAGWPNPVSVSIVDSRGEVVTTADDAVTIEIQQNSNGAVLDGVKTRGPVNGVAHFPDIRIRKIGTGYVLTATAPGLESATSVPFDVDVGPAARLGFTVQPASVIARTEIPPFSVSVFDLEDNVVTTATPSITIGLIQGPSGATLSGTISRHAENGVATFSGIAVNKPGVYILRAEALSLAVASSATVPMTNGPPATLEFATQPSNGPIGLLTPVSVTAFDALGNTVESPSINVTLTLDVNPSGGELTGARTVPTIAGVATFAGLSIETIGNDYRLIASAPGVAQNVVSRAFSIRDAIRLTTITSGYFHACGIGADGITYCWGNSAQGQVTSSRLITRLPPTPIDIDKKFTTVSSGRDHTCGLTADGIGYCWGANFTGQLAAAVLSNFAFSSIRAGYNHSCGTTPAGVGYCWGDNGAGELGSGNATSSGAPSIVAGELDWILISPGRLFSCGLTRAGKAYCWGDNFSGQLGIGTTTRSLVPVAVGMGADAALVSISAGGFHACGLTSEGAAYCWGSNAGGQLGIGSFTSNSPVPVAVSGNLRFASLSAGNRHTCGVTVDGEGYCWGENLDGMLGDGSATNRAAPTKISGDLKFAEISAGRFHTCGVTTSDAAYCWGANGSGMLGDGTGVASAVPRRIR